MAAAPTFQRTPLVITDGALSTGSMTASFLDGDRESLLRAYLLLVRRARGQQRERAITLRREDIEAIAIHLGASEELVLDDLLERMGVTRAQRNALIGVLAMGALSIIITGSGTFDLTPSIALTAQPAVVGTQVVPSELPVVGTAPIVVAPAVPIEIAPDAGLAVTTAPDAGVLITDDGISVEAAGSAVGAASAVETQPITDLGIVPGEGIGVADDGSVVAVVDPPLPLPEGVGVADDGSIVAVAEPPLQLAVGVGVADIDREQHYDS